MGMNRRFQAKRAKYSNVCIFKTTNAIATKFCTVIKTIKFSLWVVPKFAPQIEKGWTAGILKNVKCDISVTVWPILVKFGTAMHIRPPNLAVNQKRILVKNTYLLITWVPKSPIIGELSVVTIIDSSRTIFLPKTVGSLIWISPNFQQMYRNDCRLT